VAGHSQGGFAALLIGGAKVNPDLFLKYQRGWKDNPVIVTNIAGARADEAVRKLAATLYQDFSGRP
jgi:predicted dienelactone hydrolase